MTPDYVIWLDDNGPEALSFAPPALSTGWARYFRETGMWADVLMRFGLSRPSNTDTPEQAPIKVRQMAAVLGAHDPLASVVRDVPIDRLERAVNLPAHHSALTPWLNSALFVPIPARGRWSSTWPSRSETQDRN